MHAPEARDPRAAGPGALDPQKFGATLCSQQNHAGFERGTKGFLATISIRIAGTGAVIALRDFLSSLDFIGRRLALAKPA